MNKNKEYIMEISHSYNKEKNLLLSVIRIYYNNKCEEKYDIIDLTTMKSIETDHNLICTTCWEEIKWEELYIEDDR